jgi:hypothetical protein
MGTRRSTSTFRERARGRAERAPLLTVTVTGSLEIGDGGVQSDSAVYSGAK